MFAAKPERLGRLGVELVVAARRRLAPGCIHRAECIGRRRSRRAPRRRAIPAPWRAATPAHAIRNTRTPSIAAASAGSAGIGSRTSSKQAAAGSGAVEDRGPLRRGRPWRRSATWRRSGSRGRGRPTGVSSGSASVGTRSVSASQIGKSWITGRAAVERRADRGHLRGRATSYGARRGVARRRRSRAGARPRTAPSAKIASSGPSQATGRVQPSRAAEPRRCPASSAPSAETISRTCDRAPRRGGRCPRSSPPGTARLVTRNVSTATSRTGRSGAVAALPRQREQADERHRDRRAAAGR